MFRDRVVGHYVGRGYRVDTDAVLGGTSGGKHKVDLVATDDLGRLAVWWGDREPFEGPELESIKRAARDLGAAPAVAAPQVTATLRDNARRHGVVIVDEPLLDSESAKMARPLPPRPLAASFQGGSQKKDYPPWPEPEEPEAPAQTDRAERSESVQAPWREERGPVDAPATAAADAPHPDAPRRAFDWLDEQPEPQLTTSNESTWTRREPLMPAFWGPVLYTAIALLVVIVVLALVL